MSKSLWQQDYAAEPSGPKPFAAIHLFFFVFVIPNVFSASNGIFEYSAAFADAEADRVLVSDQSTHHSAIPESGSQRMAMNAAYADPATVGSTQLHRRRARMGVCNSTQIVTAKSLTFSLLGKRVARFCIRRAP
jgi:hypothetical protein